MIHHEAFRVESDVGELTPPTRLAAVGKLSKLESLAMQKYLANLGQNGVYPMFIVVSIMKQKYVFYAFKLHKPTYV